MRLRELFKSIKNGTFWGAFTALFGAIAALAALVAVIQVINAGREEQAAKRPYLQIDEGTFTLKDDGRICLFVFKFKNIGARPASEIQQESWVFEAGKPILQPGSNSIANDIPGGGPYILSLHHRIGFSKKPDIVPPQSVVIRVKYSDPILKIRFEQLYFFKWRGMKEGAASSAIDYMTIEERDTVLEKLKSAPGFI
ncbi:MAG: hypothetical protein V2A78_06930 [bacterium]